MEDTLEKRIAEALANPKNLGEMEGADAIGSVGSPTCGDMVRMWVKFKEEKGRKVIDRATFQTFGCETAIAVASLATEMIKGKTVEEALTMTSQDLAGGLGPLPPMKIHCGQLVEGALRSALDPASAVSAAKPATSSESLPKQPPASGLLESFTDSKAKGSKIVILN